MDHSQLKNILRKAVIAALPITATVACMPAETIKTQESPPEPAHPCGTPLSSKPINKTISVRSTIGFTKEQTITAEQCLELCERTAKFALPRYYQAKTEFKNFKASQCNVTPTPKNHELVSCKVSYTELKYPKSNKPGCFSPAPRPIPGRMPVGMKPITISSTHSLLGNYFANMAMMEKAAITAFQYLVRELEAYEAPQELIELARKAIAEEARHTKMASNLSKGYNTEIPEFIVNEFQLRSLFEIALENAVEGCVNESFAATCGLWQHAHAEHDVFREVIGHITEEEIGHGALSWSIHEWIMPQLTEAQQAHVLQAQAKAFDTLEENFKLEEHPEVRIALGLPNQTEASALIHSFREQVLSA